MLDLYSLVTAKLIASAAVTGLVSSNAGYESDPADAYAIRPGRLNADDVYPGIVLALPTTAYQSDLGDVERLAVVQLQVRALSEVLSECWQLRDAVLYGAGNPQASQGLHGWSDSAAGLLSCQHESDSEEEQEFDDGSDRVVWIVESVFRVEFLEGV